MALTRAWQSAINDKLTGPMVMNLLRQNPFISKLMEDKSWIGTGELDGGGSNVRNSYIIEFLGSTIGAAKVGAYQSSSSVQVANPVRGFVQSYVDFTGTLKVYSQDLRQHKGKKLTQSLFGKLEKQTTNIMARHKNHIEDMILNNSVISEVTSIDDIASGLLTVTRPEKFEIGMGVQLAASGATTKGKELFVISVNKNTKKIGFSTSLGSSASDLTDYVGATAAATTICVNGTVSSTTGLVASGMDSIESILLPSGTGSGGSTYLGQTKTAYPFLQAAAASGASLTAENFLEKLFEIYVTDIGLRTKHPEGVKPRDVFLSPNNYAIACANLEDYKGQFTSNDLSGSNPYGWEGIKIGSKSKGAGLDLFECESLKDSIIPILNMDTFAIVSNGGVQFEEDPNRPGEKFWSWERATTGLSWLLDFVLSGQFVCGNPESNAILHDVSMSL
jgi:hypothetical protein